MSRKGSRRRLRDSGEARIVLEETAAGHIEAGETHPRRITQRPGPWMIATGVLLLLLAAVVAFTGPAPTAERTLRYSIPLPPEALTFSFALSPDGRYLAIESVVDRTTQIFLRSQDSEELRLIPGTDNAGNPFWSPDSRHIAFFADERLKRVPVSGGPAEELADVPGIFGTRGTWGRDGAIVVAGSSKYDPGPLRRVPETGGQLSPLTTTPPGESHWFPQLLPDGRHFLYTSRGGSSPGIYLASLGDPAGQRLLADISSAHLATPGADGGPAHLLFMRDGNLMAQPFDLDSLTLAGDVVILLEQQPSALVDDGMASVSVDEIGTLVYAGGSVRATNSRFAWLDRSGTVVAQVGPIGPPAPVGLSPDESAIVVPRPLGPWQSDLWRRDLARDSEQRLTFQTLADVASNVVWSPDGTRIVFSISPAFDLFSMNPLATSPPQAFFRNDRPKYPTDWSDDGQYLLYTELGADTVADLWYLRIENAGGGETRVAEAVPFLQTPFLTNGGTLSPDGRWIAYMSFESGDPEVYVRPFPGGAGQWKISSSGRANHPQWSADGRELFYLTGPASRLTLMRTPVSRRVPASAGAGAVFEFGTPEPLFTLPINSFNPATGTLFYAPSRDGRRFLVNYIDLTEDPVLHVVTNWQRAFGLVPAN